MSQPTSGSEEYEKAILWVPDPNSPAGWIRRKVWAPEEEPRRRVKPPLGFGTPGAKRTE
jgi:hypothetical protein